VEKYVIGDPMNKPKTKVTLPATVEKVIPPSTSGEKEKAQIHLDNGEDLYKEIRIENELQKQDGSTVRLKKGAQVQVTVEADSNATIPAYGTDKPQKN